MLPSNKEHDITVGFFALFEQSLLNHLSVIHEADELPVTKMYDALWHVERHVNNCDFFVLNSNAFLYLGEVRVAVFYRFYRSFIS